MSVVVAEQERVPEPFCNAQFSESGLGTGSLAEGRVFFCRESLHYTDVLFMLRFDGALDSILNTFKRICSMELKPSLMSSGASSLLSSALFSVISDSECKVLEDETGSDSAFDYLCDSYTERRYPFLVVTRKTPATAYKNCTNEFTYSLGTPVTNGSTELTRSEVLDLLGKMSASDLVPFPVRDSTC